MRNKSGTPAPIKTTTLGNLRGAFDIISSAIVIESSRRKTKVGFPPIFVFRPLTPPYMRVRIRRFLICNDTFRSIPTMTDNLLARGFYCSLRLSVLDYLPLPNIPYLHFPTDMHAIVVFHILLDCAHAFSGVSSFSICTCGCACEAIHP